MTKIADFFVQITAKGDLKELKQAYEIHKALVNQSAQWQKQIKAYTNYQKTENKAKERQQKHLQKLNEKIWKEQEKARKEEEQGNKKKPKTLKEYLVAQGKVFQQQNKMNGLIAKGVLQTVGLTGAVMALGTAFVGAVVVVDKMIMKLAQANQLYTNFSRQTGLPMQSAMGIGGAMANLDFSMTPQDIMANMQQLQSNLVGIQFGMGNIAPYQISGIQAWGGSADRMLETIRKRMKRFAPEMRTFLLQQMGLDPRLGVLSDLSDSEFAKLRQDGIDLYLSPDDRKRMQELTVEWNKAGLKVTKNWEKFTIILAENTQGLAKAIQKWSDIIFGIVNNLINIGKMLLNILSPLMMILQPIYLILEDIAVWLAGGKSVIGNVFKDAIDTKGQQDITKTMSILPFMGNPLLGHAIGSTIRKVFSMNNTITINATDQLTGHQLSQSLLPTMNIAMATLTSGGR